MADAKYEEMYKQLKEEAEATMQSKSLDNCIEDFKKTVNERTESIHQEIDKAVEEVLEYGLKAFNSENLLVKVTDEVEIKEEERFDVKANLLIKYINNMLKQTASRNKIVAGIAEETVDEMSLFKFKDGKMEFKILNRLKVFSTGKVDADLGWQKVQNQPSYSKVDTTDEKLLEVMGGGCYNHYRTDKEILSDQNMVAEFESTVTQDNNYFYFGVANETVVPSSNCMCCSISMACYIYHQGNICVHGTSLSTESALEWKTKSGAPTNLKIRVMGADREVFFTVDDKEEKGPYKLQGQKWVITFGSCNTSRGKIRILSSYMI